MSTTRQVRVDSEILVMYQPDRGFFGGVHGRCRCCLCEKLTPECCAEGSDVLHRWAQWGACGAPVFEGANKLALIMFTSVTCKFTSVTCTFTVLEHACSTGKIPCQHGGKFSMLFKTTAGLDALDARKERQVHGTIPLFHTISARPPKQPRMVRTFLKVHTRPRLAYALRCRGS